MRKHLLGVLAVLLMVASLAALSMSKASAQGTSEHQWGHWLVQVNGPAPGGTDVLARNLDTLSQAGWDVFTVERGNGYALGAREYDIIARKPYGVYTPPIIVGPGGILVKPVGY